MNQAKRVFQLSTQGKTPTEIAEICQISEQEVRDILE